MDAERFVDVIRLVVRRPAIDGTIANLAIPPGRRPSAQLTEASAFYRSLSDDEKARVEQIVTMAVDEAVFGLLSVIDGVRSVSESPGRRNRFELSLSSTLINRQDGPFLYELYNSKADS